MDIRKINEIQGEARGIFDLLQQLNAPMTENNIAILNASLGSLKLIGQICEDAKKAAEKKAAEGEEHGETDAE